MLKSKKFIIVAVVAVVAIIVGATAGIALAANPPETERGSNKLLARVAEILDIPQDRLVEAFKQASAELREQRRDAYFQNLIDEGKLTQQQVEEYKQWLQDRPDIPLPGLRRGPHKPFKFGLYSPETE